MKKEIFYISNLFSIFRFVLLIPVVLLLISGTFNNYIIASVLIILIWLTDVFDGYIARKRKEITELGKILDPLADKTTIISIGLILLLKNIIPLWFALVIFIRDAVILAAGLYLKHRHNKVLQSNLIGKLTAFLIGFTLLLSLVFTSIKLYIFEMNDMYHIENLELYSEIMFLICIAMSVLSLISYFYKLRGIKSNIYS
jgi:CDP-diacylglycerol--glycerol-3-phosphate 3-phosphatidyltransferase